MPHTVAVFKKGELVTGNSTGKDHAEARVELIPFLSRSLDMPFPFPYKNEQNKPISLSAEAVDQYNMLLNQFLSTDSIEKSINSWPSASDNSFSVVPESGNPSSNSHANAVGTRVLNIIELNVKIFDSIDRAKSEAYEISREIDSLRDKGIMAAQQHANEVQAKQEAQNETQKLAALHPRFFLYPIAQQHKRAPGIVSCKLEGIRDFNAPADCPNAEAFVNAMHEKKKGNMPLTADEAQLMGWLSTFKNTLSLPQTPEPPPPSPAASAKGAPPSGRTRH